MIWLMPTFLDEEDYFIQGVLQEIYLFFLKFLILKKHVMGLTYE